MSSPKADDNETEGSVSGDKIRIKFIFANRDGLNVEIEYPMSDSVGMLKSTLLSMWPKGMEIMTSLVCLNNDQDCVSNNVFLSTIFL